MKHAAFVMKSWSKPIIYATVSKVVAGTSIQNVWNDGSSTNSKMGKKSAALCAVLIGEKMLWMT